MHHSNTPTVTDDSKDVVRAEEESVTNLRPSSSTKNQKMKPVPLFLQKLYHMLEHSTNDTIECKIVSWDANDPACFVIRNLDKFREVVLPKYFSSAMSSFKRQLNYYGFVKIHDSEPAILLKDAAVKVSQLSYRHEHGYMRRGCKSLLQNIRRLTCSAKPNQTKRSNTRVENCEKKTKRRLSGDSSKFPSNDRISHLESEVAFLKVQLTAMSTQMALVQKFVLDLNVDTMSSSLACSSQSNFLGKSLEVSTPFLQMPSTGITEQALDMVDDVQDEMPRFTRTVLTNEEYYEHQNQHFSIPFLQSAEEI